MKDRVGPVGSADGEDCFGTKPPRLQRFRMRILFILGSEPDPEKFEVECKK